MYDHFFEKFMLDNILMTL